MRTCLSAPPSSLLPPSAVPSPQRRTAGRGELRAPGPALPRPAHGEPGTAVPRRGAALSGPGPGPGPAASGLRAGECERSRAWA